MNQQNLSAYLNLIQALLTCPDGEEWNLLHQHEELVNTEFVQFMEQISQQLTSDGKLGTAQFLDYWVEQLNHVLVESANSSDRNSSVQNYLNLIQSLLDCSEGKEEEILAANQNLVDSRFMYLMRQIARQMAVRGEKEAAVYLMNLTKSITQTLAKPANFTKQKIDPEIAINHLSSSDYTSQNPHFGELTSRVINNPSQNNSKSNFVATPSQQQESFQNKSVAKKLDTIVESLKKPSTSQSEDLREKQTPETSSVSRIDEKLDAIANSLHKLEHILALRSQPANPLWYMDILERAQASNWLLTSEEIEQLIGTKPKCEPDKDTFQPGCWIFTKVGKIGSKTAWKISK